MGGDLVYVDFLREPGFSYYDNGTITDVSPHGPAHREHVQVGWQVFAVDGTLFTPGVLEKKIQSQIVYQIAFLKKDTTPGNTVDGKTLEMLDRRTSMMVEAKMDLFLVEHFEKVLRAMDKHKSEVAQALGSRARSRDFKKHLLEELGEQGDGQDVPEGAIEASSEALSRIDELDKKIDTTARDLRKQDQDNFERLVKILEFAQRKQLQPPADQMAEVCDQYGDFASKAELQNETQRRAREIATLHEMINRELMTMKAKVEGVGGGSYTPAPNADGSFDGSRSSDGPIVRTIAAVASAVRGGPGATRTIYLPKRLNGVTVLKRQAPVCVFKATSEDFGQKPEQEGVGYRFSKKVDDKDEAFNSLVRWGECIQGVEEGEGWIRCEVSQR